MSCFFACGLALGLYFRGRDAYFEVQIRKVEIESMMRQQIVHLKATLIGIVSFVEFVMRDFLRPPTPEEAAAAAWAAALRRRSFETLAANAATLAAALALIASVSATAALTITSHQHSPLSPMAPAAALTLAAIATVVLTGEVHSAERGLQQMRAVVIDFDVAKFRVVAAGGLKGGAPKKASAAGTSALLCPAGASRGLINNNTNTCWLNSVVQALFHLPTVRAAIHRGRGHRQRAAP